VVFKIKFVLQNRQLSLAANRYVAFIKKIMIRHFLELTIVFNLLTISLFSQTSVKKDYLGRVFEIRENSKIPLWPTKIYLIKQSDTLFTGGTAMGYFEFPDIIEGSYKIIIKSNRHKTLDSTISIKASENENYFVLKIDTTFVNQEENIADDIYDRNKALQDIQNNSVCLFIPGGIVDPRIYPSDTIFELKYNLSYHSNGCVLFEVKEYNETVFEYLDKTFGSDWRKYVRKDVIGLKK